MAKSHLDATLCLKKYYDEQVKLSIRFLMVEIAKENGITSMDFTEGSITSTEGKRVSNLDLCNLGYLYQVSFNDEFNGIWKAAEGWIQ